MSLEIRPDLKRIGWNPRCQSALEARFGSDAEVARVVWCARGAYRLLNADGVASARLAGAFEYCCAGPADRPVVGDWVVAEAVGDPKSLRSIIGKLDRFSTISRKQAGRETVEQVLAANVDIGCIVLSFEGARNSNPRAVERYLTTVRAGGALPILLVNKSDLAEDPDRSVDAVRSAAPGVEVIPVSCLTGSGVDEIRLRIPAGTTAVLLGPSGVGKSTLINRLTGTARQSVGAVRSDDKRGRHTTTHRELILLPDGGAVIDTPGLRELQLWTDESDLDDTFPEIAAFAESCRFRDCSHSGEPGCAVQAALTEGAISFERFASYLDLQKQVAFLRGRSEERFRREKEDRLKEISRQIRRFSKEKRVPEE